MIVSRMHGLALAVKDANKNAGAQVIPWTKSGEGHFLWYDDYQSRTIRSAVNGYCLEARGNLHRIQDKK